MPSQLSLPVLRGTASPDVSPSVDAAHDPFVKPEGRVLATLEEDGSRRWLRPKLSRGKWWRRRRIVAWALIVVFALLPWTSVAGMPTILLDVVDRKLVFFGALFRPTETLVFALLSLSVLLGVFLLTALFGRVWCGWACPQTVYLEFVYRPLERVFLGQGKGHAKGTVPVWRRVAMYAAFAVVSAHLANTFLAWFVGADRLTDWIFTSSPWKHPVAFTIFAATTLLMLFDFAFFREQLCSLVCPYGRFQSALLDRDSLIVGYDRLRGEPRAQTKTSRRSGEVATRASPCSGMCGCDGKGGCGSGRHCDGQDARDTRHARDAKADRTGDCVNCTMCVQTCPAGIDIRDGLQLECVQCTQCIDACDAVMMKLGRPTGLIRYASERTLTSTPAKGIRTRLLVYPLLLLVALTGVAWIAITRQPAAVAILRAQGIPYTVHEGTVESIVRLRIDNRTRETRTYIVQASADVELAQSARVDIAGDSSGEADVVVLSARDAFRRGRREIELVVRDVSGAWSGTLETHVLGPIVLSPIAAKSQENEHETD